MQPITKMREHSVMLPVHVFEEASLSRHGLDQTCKQAGRRWKHSIQQASKEVSNHVMWAAGGEI